MKPGSPWMLLSLFVLTAAPRTAAAAEVAFAAGSHNVLDGGDSTEGGLELRGAPLHLAFLPRFIPDPVPVAGLMATSESLGYGYLGFRLNFPLGERWLATPGFAAGVFRRGDGADLGGPAEFRSSIEAAYRLTAASRLGVAFYHLSNAGLYRHNPGSESLVLAWTVGLRP